MTNAISVLSAALLFASAAVAQQPKPEAKKDEPKAAAGPKATVTLTGRTVKRSRVSDDTGMRLVWRVVREFTDPKTKMPAKTETEVDARADAEYVVPDDGPGRYTVTLEIWTAAKDGRNKDGYHTAGDARTSKFAPIAPAVVIGASPVPEAASVKPADPKAAENGATKK